jgi:hypothetical protein
LALDAPRAVRILRGELEKVAREFREPTELQDDAENGTLSGPEPFAVIHRCLNVVPELPQQQTLNSDCVI